MLTGFSYSFVFKVVKLKPGNLLDFAGARGNCGGWKWDRDRSHYCNHHWRSQWSTKAGLFSLYVVSYNKSIKRDSMGKGEL